MTSVAEAEALIQAQARNYGVERVPLQQSLGRVLALDLTADRYMPPFNRVTMDGIAIRYNDYRTGTRTFRIIGTQAAGDPTIDAVPEDTCVEIMTGAALPAIVDTVVRYEDLTIKAGKATILTETLKPGQNIHPQGQDKKAGEVVAAANTRIDAALVGVAASVGATELRVKTLPQVLVISTGDELVEIEQIPQPQQIRRSNNYTVLAALQAYGLQADQLHLPDDAETIHDKLSESLAQYDVLVISGGVSMGKFDHVPKVLEQLGVKQLFHKVQQRPGKPFWFGKHANGVLVFALPGNPVSTFMCLHRYFIPWLKTSIGLPTTHLNAALTTDFVFEPPLQYFLQVRAGINQEGQLVATTLMGNGSGDYANLVEANAFLELPATKSAFKKGELYRLWPFKELF